MTEFNAREANRIGRVITNLRHQYQYGIALSVFNYLPYTGDIGDILTDQDETVYYGNLHNFGSTHAPDSDYAWSRAIDSVIGRDQYGTEQFGTPMVEFPLTTYSDYSGSTVERSNCEVLLEGSSDTGNLRPFLRETYGGHGTRGIVIPLVFLTDRKYSGEWIPEFHSALRALADYPLLDDEAHSQLEWECVDEAIDNYGLWDIGRDAEDRIKNMLTSHIGEVNDAFSDVVDSIAERFADSVHNSPDDAPFKEWFYAQLSDSNFYPHPEDSGGSIHWEGADDEAARALADSWVATGRLPWVAA